jgi:branched-chain amino acid transport system permease protein
MDILIGSLAIGAVYALVAIGIVLTYRATGIVNFAQGELMMVSAYCAVFAGELVGSSVVELLVVLAAGAAAGLVCFALTHVLLRGASQITRVIGTLGLLILLQAGARYFFTDIPMRAEGWLFGDAVISIFGATVPANSILVLAVAVSVAAGLLVWQNTTTFGRAVLAAAEDPWRAALTGINVRTTLATSWALGGMLAGLAGILLAPVIGVYPAMGADVIFPAFIAAILGGFSSILGALLGGLLLGLIQTYAVVYFGGALKDVATFTFLLLILLWRPTGLLRENSVRKV